MIDRRKFLFGTGAAIVLLSSPRMGNSQVQVQRAEYPRQWIGNFSQLRQHEPIPFRYPWDHEHAENVLMKLGEPAGGGIGPESDVVAFNSLCTHQGASLSGSFDTTAGIAGPCPWHWTTFDLTRHGMVVSGHATLGLPQIMLEAAGDSIYAVGVQGLIFGYSDNRQSPV
jgi:arsenite oxidase small subunit